MRAVYKRPGEAPVVMDIHNDLETLQRMVEGHIEHVTMYDHGDPASYGLIINEEGKLLDMEPNFKLYTDVIMGPAVVVGEAGEEFTDLTEEEAEEIVKALNLQMKRD